MVKKISYHSFYRELAIKFYRELGGKFECMHKGKGRCSKRLTFHHSDGNKKNNNISNLKILCQRHHIGMHDPFNHQLKKKEQTAMNVMKGGT